jgi:preprotein translocase subunit SecD
MWKIRLGALLIMLVGIGIGHFVYDSQVNPDSRFPFKLGLDLSGGSHLVYRADTSKLAPGDVNQSIEALRDVIERRVNLFGVSEPIVQSEKSSLFSGVEEQRLIVELPGVTDLNEAIRLIGETPVLEFRIENSSFADAATREAMFAQLEAAIAAKERGEAIDFSQFEFLTGEQTLSLPTELTGRYLASSQLQFGNAYAGQLSNEPIVVLNFNSEGGALFAQITKENVGKRLAIFLDGEPISVPSIREEIPGGSATISGGFTPDEAKLLVRNLNFGALPVPIELIGTESVGASLGQEAVNDGVFAGIIGFALVAGFMLLWYRLPGLVAGVSLSLYVLLMLALFKLIPVTLTAAGIAGFILSVGMAVDANVLIFERTKEELKSGKDTREAVSVGFNRAWLSIRDSNFTSIMSAVILFWLGTSVVKGFALVFGIGVLVSMLTAITVSRTFLFALGNYQFKGLARFLFGTGIFI